MTPKINHAQNSRASHCFAISRQMKKCPGVFRRVHAPRAWFCSFCFCFCCTHGLDRTTSALVDSDGRLCSGGSVDGTVPTFVVSLIMYGVRAVHMVWTATHLHYSLLFLEDRTLCAKRLIYTADTTQKPATQQTPQPNMTETNSTTPSITP